MSRSTTKESSNLWNSILSEIETKIGTRQYNLWFKNSRLISFDNEFLSIGVPNQFVQTKIRDIIEPLIKVTIKAKTGIKPSINLLDENSGNAQINHKRIADIINPEKP